MMPATDSDNIAAIRRLLNDAFAAEDLRRFCYDRPIFRPITSRFSPNHGLDDLIDEVIIYCEKRLLFGELLAAVAAENPAVYAEHAPDLGVAARPVEPSGSDRGVGPRPAVGPRPTTTARAPAVAPPGPIRDRWALLVGINRYVDPAFAELRFCVNDVLALAESLQALGYTVVALHDDAPEERLKPTRNNIEAELASLCHAAQANDLLWVHFACHGKLLGGQPVLVTRDARDRALDKQALPLAEVEKEMRGSLARRLILTLDACHTGVEIGRDLADPAFIRNAYDLAEGFALIAGSTAQQIAHEWAAMEHGVFTYYLLEALSGRADAGGKQFVTVHDLALYVLDKLRHWNVEHGGRLQEPTARTEGLGDIIVADRRQAAHP